MSTTLAFAPWARSGIGATITAPPGALRAQVPIDVVVEGRIGDAPAPAVGAPTLMAQILGPGDVLGIDPRIVIRTDPGAYGQGVPPETLVSVEFSRPDFPWMFSPLAPDAQHRLQPWLCLLVVPRRPGISLESREGRLQVLTLDSPDELPDLAEAWAWAHAQALSDDAHPPGAVVNAGDERSLSRLVSPRRLESTTSYYACLVPTFNAGRQAALDPAKEPAGPLAPAWSGAIPARFELPVYYAWTFTTGEAGDFHDLVMKLRPQALPAGAGWRPLSIGFPTAQAPSGFRPFTASLEGVLRNVADSPGPSDPAAAASLGQELLRVTGLPRAVVPPRYGQAQAPIDAPWLAELSSNPVARIAAAAGVRVVQARQEALMAAAWEQVGDIQHANQQRRHAEVALAVGDALMRRHLQALPTARLLQVAAPTGVPTSGGPMAAATVAQVPSSTLNGAFRQLQRRAGSLARRSAESLTTIAAQPLAPAPSAMTVIAPVRIEAASPGAVAAQEPAVVPFPEGDGEPSGRTGATAFYKFNGFIPASVPERPRPSTIVVTTAIVGAAVPWRLDDKVQFRTDPVPAALARRQAIAASFKTAAQPLQNYLVMRMLPKATTVAISAQFAVSALEDDSARARVLNALSPRRALVARVLGGHTARRPGALAMSVGIDDLPAPSTPFPPLRYDPVFTGGMYRELAELAPDLFLVAADRVADNSVGLARINPQFVEAYLAGLNHEMGRELLWRGFPSDGRGTYFRRFLDTDDYPALAAWRGALGAHGPARDPFVLLIRGEIVRRFPRATMFAQRGSLDASGARFAPAGPRHLPRFRVTLGNDLLCVGFDLSRSEALECFFGIEEHIAEPRFAAKVPGGKYVTLADLSLRSGAHAGDVASLVLRRPVRVLIDPRFLIP